MKSVNRSFEDGSAVYSRSWLPRGWAPLDVRARRGTHVATHLYVEVDMDKKHPAAKAPDQYPERDKVDDLDHSGEAREPRSTPRDRQEQGNAGPGEQPGFGQGA